jgi:hypothetical protein
MRYPRFVEPESLPSSFRAHWASPPDVHMDPIADHGVLRTDFSCYRFIADHIDATSRTLETGLGMSTVLFSVVGCDHTSLFLEASEGDALRAWAQEREVPLDRVTLIPTRSDQGLQKLGDEPVDLYLIDGGHGYPIPQLDWFYGAPLLRAGGILVIDDLQLWGPAQLDLFLDHDPRWELLARTPKWGAYRRRTEGAVAEDYDAQTFLPGVLAREPIIRRAHVALSRQLPESLKARLRGIVRP